MDKDENVNEKKCKGAPYALLSWRLDFYKVRRVKKVMCLVYAAFGNTSDLCSVSTLIDAISV